MIIATSTVAPAIHANRPHRTRARPQSIADASIDKPMPGTVVGVASEKDVIVLQAEAKPSDVLALLDERSVAGKQLHVFENRVNMVISRENLHDEPHLRAGLQ